MTQNKLSLKMEKLAKEISNTSERETSIKKFKEIAASPEEYFNEGPFPKNETGDEAQSKCSSERSKEKQNKLLLVNIRF